MSEELPDGWAVATLGDVAQVRLGKMLDKAKRVTGTHLPYLRNANVRWGGFALDDLLTMPFLDEEVERFGVQDGDLFVCEGGEPGRCAIWTGGKTNIKFQKAILRVRPQQGVEARWILFALRAASLTGELEQYFTGTTIKHFPQEAVLRFQFSLAPLAEQRRIVAKVEALLAQVNAARERLEKVPLLLKRLRQSVLAKAFRGELVPTEAELAAHEGRSFQSGAQLLGQPDTEGTDDLPEGWAETQLGDLIDGFQAGRNLSAQGRPAGPNEFGVLRISAVTWGTFRPEENKALLEGDHPKPHELVKRGDLLITRANTSELVGAVVLVGEGHPKLMLPDKILRILPKASVVEPRFLLHALRSDAAREHFSSNATGTSESMRNLSQPKLAATPIRLPPLAEQHRIVTEVEALLGLADSLENAIERTRAGLARAPQSVLQRAFSGGLVPTEAALAIAEGREFESANELLAKAGAVGRDTPPKTRKVPVKTADAVADAIRSLPAGRMTFEDLRNKVPVDYELLRQVVFDLLAESPPALRQVFSEKNAALMLERVTK